MHHPPSFPGMPRSNITSSIPPPSMPKPNSTIQLRTSCSSTHLLPNWPPSRSGDGGQAATTDAQSESPRCWHPNYTASHPSGVLGLKTSEKYAEGMIEQRRWRDGEKRSEERQREEKWLTGGLFRFGDEKQKGRREKESCRGSHEEKARRTNEKSLSNRDEAKA